MKQPSKMSRKELSELLDALENDKPNPREQRAHVGIKSFSHPYSLPSPYLQSKAEDEEHFNSESDSYNNYGSYFRRNFFRLLFFI